MIKIIFVLSLFLVRESFGASGSGNISNIVTLGGISTTPGLNIAEANSQGYFTLHSGLPVSAGNVGAFFKNGVQYQVTAAKTFKAIKICTSSGTAGNPFQLLTSTATFANNGGTGTLTSPVYQGLAAGAYSMKGSATIDVYQCLDFTYDFQASTFPGWQTANANSYVTILGKEI